MIANKSVQIEEQEGGTYVYPAVDLKEFHHSWALYVWPDGSADLYTRRSETGALLGKPVHLKAPEPRGNCDHKLTPEKLDGGNEFRCEKCTRHGPVVPSTWA